MDTFGRIPRERTHTQITLDASPRDEQRVSRAPSFHTERRDTTTNGTASAFLLDRPARPAKGALKALPVPVGELPSLQIEPVSRNVIPLQVKDASHMDRSVCNCGSRFPRWGSETTHDLTCSHRNSSPRTRYESMPMRSSCPGCRDVNGDSCCHPHHVPTIAAEPPHLRQDAISTQRPVQSTHDDPRIAEQETFHIIHSRSGGRDSVNAASPTSQFKVAASDHGADAAGSNCVTNDPLHPPAQGHTVDTSTPAVTALENAPLPPQDDPNTTPTPPTHRNAADAFLVLTQRHSRQRSIDDLLERGMIGSQFEVETELSPWVDVGIFGPRMKKIIVVVVLGIMLVGAAVKIQQAIQSQSSPR